MVRRVLTVGLLALLPVACTSSDPTTSGPGTRTCAADEKLCGDACVLVDEPAFGCSATSCESCPTPGAPVGCVAGACTITECPAESEDCDHDAANGCETQTGADDRNCGGCGTTCTGLTRCAAGSCSPVPVADWLAGQQGGWCQDNFNEFMNLCGDVSFCFDPDIMRTYADGLEIHVGFHYDGSSIGSLFDVGGDCETKRAACFFDTAGILICNAPAGSAVVSPVTVAAGTHLAGLRASLGGVWLYLDGVEVASGPGTAVTPELLGACGPGAVLGQRISYWWEQVAPGRWLRNAPFLFHLKGRASTGPWTLGGAVEPDADSVVLFDASGVDGLSWTDRVKGKIGLRCGGRGTPEASGYAVPCDEFGWVANVAQGCL